MNKRIDYDPIASATEAKQTIEDAYLNDRERHLLELKYLSQLTLKECATETGFTVEQVRRIIDSGIAKLAKIYSQGNNL